MEAKLIIVKGKTNRAEVTLKLPGTIGRSREADLTIAHAMISRQHCRLFDVAGLVKIRDLGSLNGTYVGQEQIKEADLPPHTEFSVGPVTFRVEYEYAGPTSETPEFLPEPEEPEGLGAGEPNFLPAAEETPAAAPSEEPPIATEPAMANPPSTPVPPSVPIASFDAGSPDLSGWNGAVQREQVDLPPEELHPTAPAAVDQVIEQPPAEARAMEDESFVGDLPVPGVSAEVSAAGATGAPAAGETPQAESLPLVGEESPASVESPIESPAAETLDEPSPAVTAEGEETIAWLPESPVTEMSAEPIEESGEPSSSEPEPTPAVAGGELPVSEAAEPAEETPAAQAEVAAGEKKSHWWSFGRGKKKAKAVAPEAPARPAAPATPAEPVSPPNIEPAPDFSAVSDTQQPQPADPPQSDEGPTTDDDALDQFFKGLK